MRFKTRPRGFITRSLMRLEIIKGIFNDYEEYKPLTLRQIFYLFLSRNNDPDLSMKYQDISNLLTDARFYGIIPFDWITDNSSYTRNKPTSLEVLAHNYYPEAWQEQDNYIEFVVEKYALYSIFSKFTRPLYITTTYATGWLTDTRAWEISKRMHKYEDKNRYICVFTDYDPSGEKMINTVIKKVNDCLYIRGEDNPIIRYKKLALTEQQIIDNRLPPRKVRTKDQLSLKWKKGYKVELDALEPRILRNIVNNNVEHLINPNVLLDVGEIEEKTKRRLLEL